MRVAFRQVKLERLYEYELSKMLDHKVATGTRLAQIFHGPAIQTIGEHLAGVDRR